MFVAYIPAKVSSMNIKKLFHFNFLKKTPKSLLGYVRHFSVRYPDHIVFQSPVRPSMSYIQLYQTLQQLREDFAFAGIQTQEHVALWVSTAPEYALASIALSDGAVCVPFSTQTTLHEAKQFFKNIGIHALVTDESDRSPIVLFALEMGVKVVFISTQNDKPCGTFTITSPLNKTLKLWPSLHSTNTSFAFQTTGSTAQPKIVPITMEAIVEASRAMLKTLELGTHDRCLNFLPLHFIHGLVTSVYVPLLGGGTVVFPGHFERNAFCTWVEKYKPTWFSASPAIYSDILKCSDEQLQALENNSLRFIRVGSAPISNQQMLALEALFKAPLIEAYGMTETLVVTCNPVRQRKIGSVGKPITSKIKLVDPSGRPCKPSQTAAIWVKGKTITKGYIDNPKANQEAFKDGWFATGDLGWMDEEGFLYLVGRTKDMINKGGQKIAPADIENILACHAGIEEAVVFALPHPVLGEDIAAAVIFKPHHTYHENEIKRYMSTLVSPHKIPQKIIAVTDFPRSENGKVIRHKLLELLREDILTSSSLSSAISVKEEEAYVKRHFEEILKKEGIAVNEDFFALGGTSLDVAALISLIGEELGEEIAGKAFVANSSVETFANYLVHYHYTSISRIVNLSNIPFQYSKPTGSHEFSMSVIGQQRKLFKSWKGERKNTDSLIAGQNTLGTKTPVFWCFHSAEDIGALALHLGNNQPLYAMRSGYLLFRMNDELIKGLATYYAREILADYPNGPYIIGGSCQAAHIAWYIVQELMAFGCKVELLCMLDATIKKSYKGKIALFYGRDDHYNPFNKDDSTLDWLSLYNDYSVDFLNVEHGKFFTNENVPDLAEKLKFRLDQLSKDKK